MCIAILNIGKKISDNQLLNCWNNNPHGAGMITIQNNKIVIHKEMNDIKKFIQKYNEVYSEYGSPIVLHFRVKTHGLTSIENCHPFNVNENLAFVHNGMIDNVDLCNVKSDTRVFNDTILQNLPHDFIYNESIIQLISNFIGYSKLIFLNDNCEYLIINEDLGSWEKCGNWYSNNSHKDTKLVKNNNWYKPTYKNNVCECCESISNNLQFETELHMNICENCQSYFSTPKNYKYEY
jgi:hypothetical protein